MKKPSKPASPPPESVWPPGFVSQFFATTPALPVKLAAAPTRSDTKVMTGQRFDHLLVIGQAPSRGSGARWICVCDCGNKTNEWGAGLRDGRVTSCGCFGQANARRSAGVTAANQRRRESDDPVEQAEAKRPMRGLSRNSDNLKEIT
jgi:hypothetical protein